MIARETEIAVGKTHLQVFLQRGFFKSQLPTGLPHMHRYTELHLILSGCGYYRVGGIAMTVPACHMLAVPQQTEHSTYDFEQKTQMRSLQINLPLDAPFLCEIAPSELSALCASIDHYTETGEALRMQLCLALICGHLPVFDCAPPTPIENRGFLIAEFFDTCYDRDVTLSDLAALLRVSEKQAARLVQKHMSGTFRDLIQSRRIRAARNLMSETDMSLEAIAERVGYRSYSGLWKALLHDISHHEQ